MNRERHTYRGNRLAQMEQWFHASLDGSDPLILENSLEQRLKLRGDPKELPQVVHNMVLWDHPWNIAIQRKNASCVLGTLPHSEDHDEIFDFVTHVDDSERSME